MSGMIDDANHYISEEELHKIRLLNQVPISPLQLAGSMTQMDSSISAESFTSFINIIPGNFYKVLCTAGTFKSKDLIQLEHLHDYCPDKDYDKDGCFSGSAIVKDDTLWLAYTGHIV